MIRPIVLTLIILTVTAANSQEFLKNYDNQVDSYGNKQGKWVVYDGNGNIKYEGAFIDGMPTGEFKYYYPGGQIKAVVNHHPDTKVAYTVNYYRNGTKMAEGKYIDQEKDSIWRYYSEIDNTLVLEEHWDHGVEVGEWKTYYPSGQVAEVVRYENGIKQGKWEQYFSDGTLKAEAEYIDGELQGIMRIFYINGNVEVSGNYKNSVKDGIWMYFTEIGEAEKKEVYKDGVLISSEEK